MSLVRIKSSVSMRKKLKADKTMVPDLCYIVVKAADGRPLTVPSLHDSKCLY